MTSTDATARAMTPRQKRDYLRAAGWRSSDGLCHYGRKRPPERWAQPDPSGRLGAYELAYDHTLGQAIRACLHAELVSA